MKLSAKVKNELPDDVFGLPESRKFPMPDKKHVIKAIQFFRYAKKDERVELAKNIAKKIEKFNMKVNISKSSLLYKYIDKKYITEKSEYIEEFHIGNLSPIVPLQSQPLKKPYIGNEEDDEFLDDENMESLSESAMMSIIPNVEKEYKKDKVFGTNTVTPKSISNYIDKKKIIFSIIEKLNELNDNKYIFRNDTVTPFRERVDKIQNELVRQARDLIFNNKYSINDTDLNSLIGIMKSLTPENFLKVFDYLKNVNDNILYKIYYELKNSLELDIPYINFDTNCMIKTDLWDIPNNNYNPTMSKNIKVSDIFYPLAIIEKDYDYNIFKKMVCKFLKSKGFVMNKCDYTTRSGNKFLLNNFMNFYVPRYDNYSLITFFGSECTLGFPISKEESNSSEYIPFPEYMIFITLEDNYSDIILQDSIYTMTFSYRILQYKFNNNIPEEEIAKEFTSLSNTLKNGLKRFSITPNGVKIKLFNESYMDRYDKIHKLLKIDKETKNIEDIKVNLCVLFALINEINQKYIYNKSINRNTDEYNEAVKARSFAINDFKTYMKIVLDKDTSFNFIEYYQNSGYDDTVVTVSHNDIQSMKHLLKVILT